MPISTNVGLSRKSSCDYQSQGQSINLTAELDSALLTKPAELQRQIAALYQQAQEALDRAATALTGEPAEPANNGQGHAKGNGHVKVNGQTPNRFPSNGVANSTTKNGASKPPLTASQKRAIYAIAQRHGIDPQVECEDECGCRLDDLTIRQASSFIDYLKNLPATNGSRKAGVR